jgi:hypothetical protein
MYGFCNVCLYVCVGFVICGCFDNCVGVLVICVGVLVIRVLVFIAFLYFPFMYIYSYLLLI